MFRFHKEGNTSILLATLICITLVALVYGRVFDALFGLQVVLAALSVILLGFMLQFFRNPARPLPKLDEGVVYVPADGKIVVIEEVEEPEFLQERCIQVSIFMSPFNVHVNRNPVTGQVLYSKHHPGKFLMAWNPKASTENERTTIAYKAPNGQRLVFISPVNKRTLHKAVARHGTNCGQHRFVGDAFLPQQIRQTITLSFVPLIFPVCVHDGRLLPGQGR